MIDLTLLPKAAMVDTGVFLRFLGARPNDPEAPVCRAFCEAMIERGHVLYVAAPTLAEIIRHHGERAPRIKGIVIVPFDDRAAELLGGQMPLAKLHEAAAASGHSLAYLKYDAMIMACAMRSKTTTLVTLDPEAHLPLAAGLSIAVRSPAYFLMQQLVLPGLPPPAAPSAPALESPVAELGSMVIELGSTVVELEFTAAELGSTAAELEAPIAAPATPTQGQLQLPW